MQLGRELGRGNYGTVYEVVGQPDVVVKRVREDAEDVDLALECEAMLLMGSEFMPKCLGFDKQTLVMERLEGPELTCEDFKSDDVQQRLLDIAKAATEASILVQDAHPGNYLFHRGRVLRIDAVRVGPVSRYGFTSVPPLALYVHNFYFIDCEDTPLLHRFQRAVEFEFGARSHLPRTDPDLETLAQVRLMLKPKLQSKLRRPRVSDANDLAPDPNIKLVPSAVPNAVRGDELIDGLVALSLARYVTEDPLDVGVDGKHVVFNTVRKAEVLEPTYEVWLANSDFDFDSVDASARHDLFLFALAVRIAFGRVKQQARVLAQSRSKPLVEDLEALARWTTLGEKPPRKLRALDRALEQAGIERRELGQALERLMEHLR